MAFSDDMEAMRFAVETNDMEYFETLLNSQANYDTRFKFADDGSTLLHCIAAAGNINMLDLVLEKVKKKDLNKVVNEVDNNGMTPLMVAISR